MLGASLVIASAGVGAGCSSLGYVAHVSAGQVRLLWDRELLDPVRIASLGPQEQAGVRAVQTARAHAGAIGLLPSTSYRHLVDRDARTSVQVVVASPRDRLEPVTWWFPIVGRVAYRGYFDRDKAQRFAEDLRAQGYDTYVRTAAFYSTLGYFDDPLPRMALRWSEVDLYDVILHELVHGTIFVSGDSTYNESLASFIAREATLELLADQPERQAEARRIYADRDRYARLIESLATDLEEAYAASADVEAALRARAEIFERYQRQVYPQAGFETARYDGFAVAELDNAFVLAQRTYSGLGPCFQAEFDQLDADLRAFIRSHRDRPGRRKQPADVCGVQP